MEGFFYARFILLLQGLDLWAVQSPSQHTYRGGLLLSSSDTATADRSGTLTIALAMM